MAGIVYTSSNKVRFHIIEKVICNSYICELIDYGFYKIVVIPSIGDIHNIDVSPYIFNVGYVGTKSIAEYKEYQRHKSKKVWMSMIDRCYSGKNKAYEDVYVCDEWHNFINFAKWYDDNYIDGWSLDKDLLSGYSKLYSPNTCCFLPSKINAAIRRKIIVNEDVHGYYFIDDICGIGKRKIYGSNIHEAYKMSLIHKQTYIKTLVSVYWDQLQYKITNRLIEFYNDEERKIFKGSGSAKAKG